MQVSDSFEGHCYVINCQRQFWLIKNKRLHNQNGPAIIDDDGTLQWFINHKIHRLDGPAILYPTGEKKYFIDSFEYQEENYWNHPKVVENKFNKIMEL